MPAQNACGLILRQLGRLSCPKLHSLCIPSLLCRLPDGASQTTVGLGTVPDEEHGERWLR
jgi:hypothetical protein